jgi:hypothetical protein
MKKSLLVLCIVSIASVIIAQQHLSDPFRDATPPPGRNFVYDCMENPVFSQVFPTSLNGHWCQFGGTVQTAVADDYSASGPFSSFRFWGFDFYGCSLASTEEFDVFIWDGSPLLGGILVHSFTLKGTTTYTPESFSGTPIYQVDINLGTTINLLNGWIGITRKGATCDQGFAWLFDSYDTGNSVQKYYPAGDWGARNTNLFFCLGGATGETIPISDWALYIGIFIMVAFAVIRFRRMI